MIRRLRDRHRLLILLAALLIVAAAAIGSRTALERRRAERAAESPAHR